MKLVILAGGRGTRLAEETVTRPKPMVEIGGQPILWHIMKIYAHHGVREFVICLGYKGYMIKEYFSNYLLHRTDVTIGLRTGQVEYHRSQAEDWTVTLVDTGDRTMTGGRLLRIRPHLDPEGPFLMTYGDGVADIDVAAQLEFHRSHGRAATVTAVRPPGRFGVLDLERDRVTQFLEKPAGGNNYINGGFFVLSPATLDLVEGDATVWEQEPLRRLATAGDLVAYRHTGFWQCMDTIRDRDYLESLWESGSPPWRVWA